MCCNLRPYPETTGTPRTAIWCTLLNSIWGHPWCGALESWVIKRWSPVSRSWDARYTQDGEWRRFARTTGRIFEAYHMFHAAPGLASLPNWLLMWYFRGLWLSKHRCWEWVFVCDKGILIDVGVADPPFSICSYYISPYVFSLSPGQFIYLAICIEEFVDSSSEIFVELKISHLLSKPTTGVHNYVQFPDFSMGGV